MRILHSPQLMSNCSRTNKNELDTPLQLSPMLGGIHMHSTTLRNTVTSLTNDPPYYILLYSIMKYFLTLPLRNLPILDNPSRYPIRSIGLKVSLYNMTRTAILASSLIPFPTQTYPEQPASSDLFYPHHQEYQ